MTEPVDIKQTASTSVTWLTLAVNFMSLLEKVLPAFLVAWNESLQQKNQSLKLQLEKAKMDASVTAFKAKEKADNDEKPSKTVIDEFLNKPSGDGSNVGPH